MPRPRFMRSDVRDILTLIIRPPLAHGIWYPSLLAPAASLPGAFLIHRFAFVTGCSHATRRKAGTFAVVLFTVVCALPVLALSSYKPAFIRGPTPPLKGTPAGRPDSRAFGRRTTAQTHQRRLQIRP